ncbi:helix-turn-helix transcriptional regulator [Crossiella cryophila]|uniref:Transcriptional regulator with XRE-family HTH domain n=1 Tax=Crossiella cryophila TaxID=43355 RepID=A0A7W7CC85_9PSEU|nr:helix-turn-helix domain-containing protein [Crossiella cryophila]MBB4678520.1 transcriptional regulator with XRE-family HTH domain [Crossiella cryophila]
MDKHELGRFLRSHRERLAPSSVGLPAAGQRRTPGLRREEVAQLAHISAQYYTRLEQARGPNPSRRVLAALGRALRLNNAERAHLYVLCGQQAEPPGPSAEVPDRILDMIERMPHTAAIVLDARYDVLAWNPLAAALLEDFSALPPKERNAIRRYFLNPDPDRPNYGMSGGGDFGRFAAGHLRAVAARYPEDPATQALIRDLLAHSPAFAELWPSPEVPDQRNLVKTINHPQLGAIPLTCDILAVPERDQHVVLFTAEPGSPAEDAMRLLAVIGLQQLA